MKLRARLIVAFFTLAVVPMCAIVLYSYNSSISAFRNAKRSESLATASQLSQWMAETRNSLDSVLGRVSAQLPELLAKDGTLTTDAALLQQLSDELGTVSPLVEAYEFIPAVTGPDGDRIEVPPQAPAPPPPERSATTTIVTTTTTTSSSGSTVATDSTQGQLFAYIFSTTPCTETAAGKSPGSEPGVPPDACSDPPVDDLTTGSNRHDPGPVQDGGGELDLGAEVLAKLEAETVRLAREQEARARERGRAEALRAIRARAEALHLLPRRLRLDSTRMQEEEQRRQRLEAVLGHSFSYPVRSGNHLMGHLSAKVQAQALLAAVLGKVDRSQGQIPFAVDREGALHTPREEDRLALARAVPSLVDPAVSEETDESWIMVRTADSGSGLSFGIARPVGAGLDEIRTTAVNNLMWGLLLVALAGLGVLPISNRLTRNLSRLNEAADSLASGDLNVRVPVRGSDEVGQLAGAFNRMAAELGEHQQRLLEHQRRHQEQELQHRLLELENQRKSSELEDARRLQLSLLPSRLPDSGLAEIAVAMTTATEVGGDFYDLAEADDGSLTVTIGDATGHGAAAGTMVTIAKSLFTAGDTTQPRLFLHRAGDAIRQMRSARMCMAMLVLRLTRGCLTVSAAGMPPLLLHRRQSQSVEEVLLPGVPLGALSGCTYHERQVPVAVGDTVLLMSDGFPELLDDDGEPLGYERAEQAFHEVAGRQPEAVIAGLTAAADRWRGARAQDDDITFVVLRIR